MEKEIIKLYTEEGFGIESICKKFKIGKLKVKSILSKNNIKLNKKGGKKKFIEKNIDYSIYENKSLQCKKTGKIFNDVLNKSGSITIHIKESYNIDIPSTYIRNRITKTTGKLWYEEYFNIIDREEQEKWCCPICQWETIDVGNNSGALTKHIMEHDFLSVNEFNQQYPNNKIKTPTNTIDYNDKNDFVECGICDEKFRCITNTHLHTHNITIEEYIKKYGDNLYSKNIIKEFSDYLDDARPLIKNNFTSKAQQEIFEFIKSLGFNPTMNDKKTLNGVEIDILVGEKNLGFEYNGLFWHSEKMGKDKHYHINKRDLANKNGVKLVHIFSDEWINKRKIVESKIKHLLGVDSKKIFARKCVIKEITSEEKNIFLNNNHIQGTDKSSHFIGGYYNGDLVAVMTFSKLRGSLGSKDKKGYYELIRFSSNNVVGIAPRLLKYFINNYKPKNIVSYADKRWTLSEDNLYTKIGFNLMNAGKPNYWYVKGDDKRLHRYSFRKDKLVSMGYDKSKTEKQIMLEIGYNIVWDCGNYKYEMGI